MTGLDPARHTIVEIATLITDDDLTVIEEGPDLVVHASPQQLAEMDEFVLNMHTRSGLLADIEALHPESGRRRGPDPRVPPASHSRGPHRSPGRQFHRNRPPFPGHPAPRDRGLPALPLGRRLDHQGAVPPLAPRGLQERPVQEGRPPRPPGHPRERRGARVLPRRLLHQRRRTPTPASVATESTATTPEKESS